MSPPVIIIITPGPRSSGVNAIVPGINNIVNVEFVGDVANYTKAELSEAVQQAINSLGS